MSKYFKKHQIFKISVSCRRNAHFVIIIIILIITIILIIFIISKKWNGLEWKSEEGGGEITMQVGLARFRAELVGGREGRKSPRPPGRKAHASSTNSEEAKG